MLLDRVYKPSMILFAECIMENVRSLKDPKGPFFPLPSTCCRLDHVGCRGLKNVETEMSCGLPLFRKTNPTSGTCLSHTQNWSPFQNICQTLK